MLDYRCGKVLSKGRAVEWVQSCVPTRSPKSIQAGLLNGYKVVYLPDHPKAYNKVTGWEGYVYAHVLVAERMLGRSLTRDEVVHHKDHDRLNNSVENIEVMTRSQHALKHWVEKCGPKPRCLICGKEVKARSCKYCSHKCYNFALRRVVRPTHEVLQQLLEENSVCAVARMFGVSDNAIRKWLRVKT